MYICAYIYCTWWERSNCPARKMTKLFCGQPSEASTICRGLFAGGNVSTFISNQSEHTPPPLLSLSPSLSGFISSPSCSLIEKRYSKRCSGEVLRSLISQLKGINCKRETREETNNLLALSLPPFLHSALVYAFLWSTFLGPPQTSWKNNTKDSSSGSFLLKKQRNKVTKVLKTSLGLFSFIWS